MITIVTIIGARPQIIKAAAINRTIRNSFEGQLREIIVHTGQHYDNNMSQVFFDELNIPHAAINLAAGSGKHGVQTAKMIQGLEEVLENYSPDYLLLYGDTNSTLAGAITAAKLHIPVIHVEAGLRSFNRKMPEEINRIVCDHCSTLLFSPTLTGYNNLIREGFNSNRKPPYTPDNPGIFHCGDVMYDNTIYFAQIAGQKSKILDIHDISGRDFILTTIHRDNNTDDPKRLNSIFRALEHITNLWKIELIFPVHPRTLKMMRANLSNGFFEQLSRNPLIRLIPAVTFLDMIMLEKHASLIITDSGGVQKEAYFFGKPCIITRSETEWTEIVEQGSAIVADADEGNIIDAFAFFHSNPPCSFPPVFGDGNAASFICQTILNNSR